MTSQIAPHKLLPLPGWVLTGLMGAVASAVLALSCVEKVNADVTGTFLVLVSTIGAACGSEGWELLAGRNARPLRKELYVALPAA
jgi:hypothetical protein